MPEREVRISTAGKLRAVAPPYPFAPVATDANGRATFVVPAGTFTSVTVAMPVVYRDTTNPNQFTSPSIKSVTVAAGVFTIVVQVAKSKNTGVLIGGVIEGLEAAGAGYMVGLVVYGT